MGYGKVAIWQAVASALMLTPLLVVNFDVFLGSTDALFYTAILRLMGDHLLAGDFHPLWLGEANGGTGSPAMLFYSPLAYHLTALLGLPLTPFDTLGSARLVFGMFAAQWVAGIGAYAWLKRLVQPDIALGTSLLFTVFPYKLIYIFVHINLAQLWALAWLPLLMLAALDIARRRPGATPLYALWLALIALTHPRTLVAFAMMPALYALVFAHGSHLQVMLKLVIAHMLGMAMAAFYLLPALLNLDLVHAELANTGRMYYADNLMHKDIVLNFHYAIIAAIALGLLSRVPSLRRSRPGHEIWFYLAMLLAVIFMCLRISKPIWDVLPILQFLQFPAARLHCVALVAVTALCAISFQNFGKVHELRNLYSPPVILFPVLAMTCMIFLDFFAIYQKADPKLDRPYIEAMHAINLILPPEYLTKWQDKETDVYAFAHKNSALPLVRMRKSKGIVEAQWVDARHMQFTATIKDEKETIRIRQLYLPNWQTSEGELKPAKDGTMMLELPHGEHHVDLELSPFRGEREGMIVTLAACLLSAVIFRVSRRRRLHFH